MKRAAVFAVCVLALSSHALCQTTVDRRSITGVDVQKVLTDFITNVSKELNSLSKGTSRRRLQGSALQNIHDFFADILGNDWSSYVPAAWKDSNFSWSALGSFEYASNLQDFLSETSLKSLVKPQSLSQLYDNLEELNEKFCVDAEFTPPALVPSECTGPTVTLAYVPKTCIINDSAKQIICSTPKLVLVKTPGSCSHKYFSPASWSGKECKITTKVGFEKEAVVGGAEYTIPLSAGLLGFAPAPAPY